MREQHITIDPMSGLFDPQPLRTFKVFRNAAPFAEVEAHVANQTEHGGLVFVVLKGGLSFVVRAFAAGQWSDFSATLPSETEVRSIRAFAEREQAITNMLMHDAKTTRQ